MSRVVVPTWYGPGWLKSTGSGSRVVGTTVPVGAASLRPHAVTPITRTTATATVASAGRRRRRRGWSAMGTAGELTVHRVCDRRGRRPARQLVLRSCLTLYID